MSASQDFLLLASVLPGGGVGRFGPFGPEAVHAVHRLAAKRAHATNSFLAFDFSFRVPSAWKRAISRGTMDDATSAITSIFLCEEEGTASSFRGLSETIRAHGLFSSFYTDRGSHYFVTPKAGAKVDKTQLTQVGRALKQLHVEHIPSYSPQARGGWNGSGTRCRSGCLRC